MRIYEEAGKAEKSVPEVVAAVLDNLYASETIMGICLNNGW